MVSNIRPVSNILATTSGEINLMMKNQYEDGLHQDAYQSFQKHLLSQRTLDW
jgi:hypothetical protein